MNSIAADFNDLGICKVIPPSLPPPRDRFMPLTHSYVFRFLARLCAFCIGVSGIATPTTFVVVPSNSGFFIGADSMRTWHGVQERHINICKIRNSPDHQVMLTWGHLGFQINNFQETVAYDPIAKGVLAMRIGIEEKRKLLEKRTEDFLKQQIEFADKYNLKPTPELYDRLVMGGALISDTFSDFGVFAFELEISDWKNRTLHHSHWDTTMQNVQMGVPFVLGDAQGWAEWTDLHPRMDIHNPTDREAVDAINTILALQSKKTPHDVGPPFAIALLGPNNLRWIEEGKCGKGQNPQQKKK